MGLKCIAQSLAGWVLSADPRPAPPHWICKKRQSVPGTLPALQPTCSFLFLYLFWSFPRSWRGWDFDVWVQSTVWTPKKYRAGQERFELCLCFDCYKGNIFIFLISHFLIVMLFWFIRNRRIFQKYYWVEFIKYWICPNVSWGFTKMTLKREHVALRWSPHKAS